jgi:hypothetical protein
MTRIWGEVLHIEDGTVGDVSWQLKKVGIGSQTLNDLERASSARVEFMNRPFRKTLGAKMDEDQVTRLELNVAFVTVDPELIRVIMEGNLASHLSMDGVEMCHEIFGTCTGSYWERQG